MNEKPPKWADKFLRWYCNPYFLEEIEGDIYELFDRRIETGNLKKARIRFVWDVFRFFRYSNIKRTNSEYTTMNHLTLLANYLKLGMRNIRRNLVSSSINIVGMSIAISFAVSIFIFTDIMRSMDSFHSNANRIYQITNYVEGEGGQNMWSDSPMLLCPAMKKDHPSVETYSRIEYRSASVKHKTDVFDELVTFVDPDFFKMFDYEMVTGEKAVLENKSQIVISHDMALKYFKDEDPIGKDLSFKFLNGAIKRFSVGAVLEKYPYNASMQFSFFIPIENFRDLRFEGTEGWSFMTDGSFIMLEEGESISSIYDSFDSYINVQHGSNPEWKVESFEAIRLDDLSSKAYQIEGSISGGAHPAGTLALTIIAVFLLAMACFNFMNISVV
ncbi:MAG: ABC transporter permease, partial [Ekhidna sp.]|nr:ABC transporter permease [Ekhidna sp.]